LYPFKKCLVFNKKMKNKQTCLCVAVVLALAVILLLNRRESLGGGTVSSGGGSYSGGKYINAYNLPGSRDSLDNDISPPGYRLGGPFRDCSPESCPHGSSVPQATLMVPGRGPFPYPFFL
jgi:hypothetical protein